MRTEKWPIRSKIIALVAPPIATLLAFWVFLAVSTVGPALELMGAQTLVTEVARPGAAVIAELQHERRLSMGQLGERDGTAGSATVATAQAGLAEQRVRTDEVVATLRRQGSRDEVRSTASDLDNTAIAEAVSALDALPAARDRIDRRELDRTQALTLYTGLINQVFRAYAVLRAVADADGDRAAQSLLTLGRARELSEQADAVLAGVFSTGRFAEGEPAQLGQLIGTQRLLAAEAVTALPAADQAAYQQLTESEPFVRRRALEDKLLGNGRAGVPPPVTAADWQAGSGTVNDQLRAFEAAGVDALVKRATPAASGMLIRLGLAGGLGLVAIAVSVVIAVRVNRSLTRRVVSLGAATVELTEERLPDVVRRLRQGAEIDVEREAPALDLGGDEVGQLGTAFGRLRARTIRSAVDEATLRQGLNEVFLNIARRSQTLLHRQLALLDRMERRASEPEELADLFQADHLATRLRRHTEDLVILAGCPAGRGWRNPVSMSDVIRGAISEVEYYVRVDIVALQPAAVVGPAVGDVIHLLAELIENATSYSPPQTRVHVAGQALPNGYAIEVEDRGVGMPSEAIEEANRRLAAPPDFDPAHSARLGLFVVAKLGARHGVRVRLRPSPYGGIAAVVLLPEALVAPVANAVQPNRHAERGPRPADDAPPHQQQPRQPGPRRPGGAGVRQPAGPAPRQPGGTGVRQPGGPLPQRASGAANRPAGRGGPNQPSRQPRQNPPAGPPAPAAPTGPASVPAPGPAAAGGTDLPRRVRLGSLAPQLRDGPPGRRDDDATTELAAIARRRPRRTPEEIGAAMSALESGTIRGRSDAGWPTSPSNQAGKVPSDLSPPPDAVKATRVDESGTSVPPARSPTGPTDAE